MRIAALICKILMWITFAVTGFFQSLALIGILIRNRDAGAQGLADKIYNPFFFILAIALAAAGVILFACLKKKKYIGLSASAVSSLLFVIVAFDMSRKFAEQAIAGGFRGLTMTDAVLRHMSPVLITLFMLLAWLFERQWKKDESLAAMFSSKQSHFDLGGETLFSDGKDGTEQMLIDGRPMTQKERRKMKREEERARRRRSKAGG